MNPSIFSDLFDFYCETDITVCDLKCEKIKAHAMTQKKSQRFLGDVPGGSARISFLSGLSNAPDWPTRLVDKFESSAHNCVVFFSGARSLKNNHFLRRFQQTCRHETIGIK